MVAYVPVQAVRYREPPSPPVLGEGDALTEWHTWIETETDVR